MYKTLLGLLFCTLLLNCASKKTLDKVRLIDLNTFQLQGVSNEATFGYNEKNPIKVGGAFSDEGVLNERRYLNALLGPKGEKVDYNLIESCCYYKITRNGKEIIGMLDKYEVSVDGRKTIMFLNPFEKPVELIAPKGFTYLKGSKK